MEELCGVRAIRECIRRERSADQSSMPSLPMQTAWASCGGVRSREPQHICRLHKDRRDTTRRAVQAWRPSASATRPGCHGRKTIDVFRAKK